MTSQVVHSIFTYWNVVFIFNKRNDSNFPMWVQTTKCSNHGRFDGWYNNCLDYRFYDFQNVIISFLFSSYFLLYSS